MANKATSNFNFGKWVVWLIYLLKKGCQQDWVLLRPPSLAWG